MISYRDLGLVILFLLAAGLGIYLFIILSHLHSILKNVRDLLERNRHNLDQTMDILPSIANNVDDAAINLRDSVEKVTNAVDTVGHKVTETVAGVSTGTQQAAEYIRIISEIVKTVLQIFDKDNGDRE